MKYFNELDHKDQNKVLDKLQDLPLFNVFRQNAYTMLMESSIYAFDDKLNMHVHLAIPAEPEGS